MAKRNPKDFSTPTRERRRRRHPFINFLHFLSFSSFEVAAAEREGKRERERERGIVTIRRKGEKFLLSTGGRREEEREVSSSSSSSAFPCVRAAVWYGIRHLTRLRNGFLEVHRHSASPPRAQRGGGSAHVEFPPSEKPLCRFFCCANVQLQASTIDAPWYAYILLWLLSNSYLCLRTFLDSCRRFIVLIMHLCNLQGANSGMHRRRG